MSIGPVVLKNQGIPSMSVVCLAFVVFLVGQAIYLSGRFTILSLAAAALFLLGALWNWYLARNSAVLIDEAQVIVKEGRRQITFDRGEVASVDLSSFRGHIRLNDGAAIDLPLEGKNLTQAGLLLSPHAARSTAEAVE